METVKTAVLISALVVAGVCLWHLAIAVACHRLGKKRPSLSCMRARRRVMRARRRVMRSSATAAKWGNWRRAAVLTGRAERLLARAEVLLRESGKWHACGL